MPEVRDPHPPVERRVRGTGVTRVPRPQLHPRPGAPPPHVDREAGADTPVVSPQLKLVKTGPAEALRCDEIVYNFEVAGAHTYTVGTTDVLVHNKAMPRAFKKPKAHVSGKEGAKDVPKWSKGNRPYQDESGKEFAERLLDDRQVYGKVIVEP